MAKPQTTSNPFYILLVVVGMVFVLTACSYFVMTLQGREASYGRGPLPRDNTAASRDSPNSEAFTRFMDQYGFTLLMIELGVLAAATFAAIGTDEYWMRRAQAAGEDGSDTTIAKEELSDESEPSRSD
jgi:hypothetical protein